MNFHGNSKQSLNKQHLYVIYDIEENDIFKYGISDKPIRKDGYSKRMREQVDLLNRAVGWSRYFAVILIQNIFGREEALDIEDIHIKEYRAKYGRNPRGNVE